MFELLISNFKEKEQFLNTWLKLEPTGDKPGRRRDHKITSIGDKLYLYGGSSGGDELWEYNTLTHTWTLLEPTGSKPRRRGGHTLTNVGDKLYLHGGQTGGPTDELWEYAI